MTAATAAVVAETADRLFASIVRGDKVAVDQLWSEDIAVWRMGATRDNNKGPRAEGHRLVHHGYHHPRLQISWTADSSTTERSAALSNNTFCTPRAMVAKQSRCACAL